MDSWKFYEITYREHDICNPTHEEKLTQLVDLLRLDEGAPVVDIACGKGEFLIRLALKYAISGIGVDRSSDFLEEARERHQRRAPGTYLTFVEMDGAEFKPESPNAYSVASCMGGSFVFKGYKETLGALESMVDRGGWVIVGEPYWRQDPEKAYLESLECERDAFGTHPENAKAGESVGLHLVHTFVSSQADFDRYQGLQWSAAETYASMHPDDPDVSELMTRVGKERDAYLQWGRDTLGWAVYVFRRPMASTS